MKDYVDLILANGTILIAPFNSCVEKGDTIFARTATGTYTYVVDSLLSCTRDSDVYAFLRTLNKREFLRATGKGINFVYDESDYDEGDSDV